MAWTFIKPIPGVAVQNTASGVDIRKPCLNCSFITAPVFKASSLINNATGVLTQPVSLLTKHKLLHAIAEQYKYNKEKSFTVLCTAYCTNFDSLNLWNKILRGISH